MNLYLQAEPVLSMVERAPTALLSLSKTSAVLFQPSSRSEGATGKDVSGPRPGRDSGPASFANEESGRWLLGTKEPGALFQIGQRRITITVALLLGGRRFVVVAVSGDIVLWQLARINTDPRWTFFAFRRIWSWQFETLISRFLVLLAFQTGRTTCNWTGGIFLELSHLSGRRRCEEIRRAAASASVYRKVDLERRGKECGKPSGMCWGEAELELPDARCLGTRCTNAKFDARFSNSRVRDFESEPRDLDSNVRGASEGHERSEFRECERARDSSELRSCASEEKENESVESTGNDSDVGTGKQRQDQNSDDVGKKGAEVGDWASVAESSRVGTLRRGGAVREAKRIEGMEKNPKSADTESSDECRCSMRQYRQHSEPENEAESPPLALREREWEGA
ncbi:hypothetical protein B0H13DRAFT_1914912 [Mycena leptocephala]|nr:hypothetical protein B0H13DRAFT_1914912 [Mycena leptocephala]